MEERIWHKSYAEGVPPSIDYEKTTLGEVLERAAKTFPDTVALIKIGKRITYRQLDELVNRFARRCLTRLALRPSRFALSYSFRAASRSRNCCSKKRRSP